MTHLHDMVIEPCEGLCGKITVPGDKSISHRAAMLCGLAEGESVLSGFLLSEDCISTLNALVKLGVGISRDSDCVSIRGVGGTFSDPGCPLDMGNSGTGMRLLAGLLAGQCFESVLIGDASLQSRPMERIKAPLELMGASVELTGPNGSAPMTIEGGRLRGVKYTLPVASAQVKSCVLLAGLFADGHTCVVEPRPTRDHTERLFSAMGIDVNVDGMQISVEGNGADGPSIAAQDLSIPGDFSSAAYWIAGAACRKGSEVTVDGVGLNSRRTALLDILRRMGADIQVVCDTENWEPVGTVHVRGCDLEGTVIAGDEIPSVIDELPLLAAVGSVASGRTTIRDAAELRTKESDRIAATVEGLVALGVTVEERDDGMIVDGGGGIRGGAVVDSRGDHRIAMAMSVLAGCADRSVTVKNVSCVDTSYPAFWADMASLSAR